LMFPTERLSDGNGKHHVLLATAKHSQPALRITTPQRYFESVHSHAQHINTVSPSIANPRAPSRTFQPTQPSFVGPHALPGQGAAEPTTNPSLSSRHDETCNFAQTATMTHEMAFRGNSCVKVKNVMVVAVGPCGIKSLLRLSRRQPTTPLTTFS